MKPMLAANASLLDIPENAIIQPKIDGVRGVILHGQLLSRTLKPIPNLMLQELLGRPHLNGLDGELVVGSATDADVCRKTVSAVMSKTGLPDVTFYVFDDFSHPEASYVARRSIAQSKIEKLPLDVKVEMVKQTSSFGIPLTELEAEYLDLGFEGIIARDPNGKYKFGRSTLKERGLLKIKQFADAEAVILSVEELVTNGNDPTTDNLGRKVRSAHQANMIPANKLGAINVKDLTTGMEFSIGSGFTEEQRLEYWHDRGEQLIGKVVTYRYFPVGVKERPRFPTFKSFRFS